MSSAVTPVSRPLAALFSEAVGQLSDADGDYVPQLVATVLREARRHRASDIHLTPAADSLLMQWRIDGVLQTVGRFDRQLGQRLVARTKVMAGLLTYRNDQPQEGRMTAAGDKSPVGGAETRVATFPTLYGERSAIRLFADTSQFQNLADIQLPDAIEQHLRQALLQTAGVILLTGPSGSGKTTTVYACLREILAVAGDSRCVMTIEDPIEQALDGTTQSQVRPSVDFNLGDGLRAMMRQDPDVIMVGEIRDVETAEQVFRAALTGHLVLTTFHAGSCAEAVVRLIELGIDPWLLRSTLRSVVCQRLVRESCSCDRVSGEFNNHQESSDNVGAKMVQSRCEDCSGTGYRGRFVLAEHLTPDNPSLSAPVLDRADTSTLESIAKDGGMITLGDGSREVIASGRTTIEEIYRVLGRATTKPDE